MSEFSTTGTLTLEMDADGDPFDWVDDTEPEEFPQSKEAVREHYETKSFVQKVGSTNGGLVIKIADAGGHSTFGTMLRNRGWTVDFVDWEDGLLHIAPIPEEVLSE